jgi:hypothetical protein
MLSGHSRQTFRDRLPVDEDSWARGRGWALWKTLVTCAHTAEDPDDAEEHASAKLILHEIFEEYTASR